MKYHTNLQILTDTYSLILVKCVFYAVFRVLTSHKVRKAENCGGAIFQFFLVTLKRVILDPGFSDFLFHSLDWPKWGCGLSPLLAVLIGCITCKELCHYSLYSA